MTDGARALLFFDARGAAGLTRALMVLGIYATGGLVLGGIVAFAIDRVAGRLTNRASTAQG
jgi:membrane protein YqaA with SNARE-associated domain